MDRRSFLRGAAGLIGGLAAGGGLFVAGSEPAPADWKRRSFSIGHELVLPETKIIQPPPIANVYTFMTLEDYARYIEECNRRKRAVSASARLAKDDNGRWIGKFATADPQQVLEDLRAAGVISSGVS